MEIFHALYVIQTNLALKENNRNLMNVKKCFENMIIFLLNDILKGTFLCKEEEQKDTKRGEKLAHEGKKTARSYYGSRNISF